MKQNIPEVPGSSYVEGMWVGIILWDRLGVVFFPGVVAQHLGVLAIHRQQVQEEERKEQRETLVSHDCFPIEMACSVFFLILTTGFLFVLNPHYFHIFSWPKWI